MDTTKKQATAIRAASAPIRQKPSIYPEPFRARVEGRSKQVLGDLFGLKNFGVNLTTLQPGAQSALMHRHAKQDEFIYILEGQVTLRTNQAEENLNAGMCIGFPAGGLAHHLINQTNHPATFLEIGDRSKGDSADYPTDDLVAELSPEGAWRFKHKDGTPYP